MKEMREMLVLGEYVEDGKMYPAARFLVNQIDFGPLSIAGMFVAAYDTFESCIAEDKKADFYEAFTEVFQKMMESRGNFSFKVAHLTKNDP